MKRMVLIAGIALSILSCAQHDTNSPDTSGNDPQNPNRTTMGDTTSNGIDSGGNNMNNDNTNNNQQVNTGDSSLNNRRNQ